MRPYRKSQKNLSDSTGAPAMTIHKALYLTVDSEDDLYEDELLEEDLIIVDECTMMDMWLASILVFPREKRCQIGAGGGCGSASFRRTGKCV